ncbi:MAG: hypothetical protein M1827_000726 [Pycnora praestabilis]|nr:MAG: hypothetical protein M1827_000726 [Pycnora praestabilis]
MEGYQSDTDRTRSASPPQSFQASFDSRPTPGMRINTLLNEETPTAPARPGRGRWDRNKSDRSNPQRIILKTKMEQYGDASSPAPPGLAHPILHPEGVIQRRPRPLTAHQLAVEKNRRARVTYILDRQLRGVHDQHHRRRRKDGAIWRSWKRCQMLGDVDSEEEGGHGLGGLMQLRSETDDFGEEAGAYAAAIRRVARRLERWEGGVPVLKTAAARRKVKKEESSGDEEGRRRGSSAGMEEEGEGEDEGELDDMDRELLGEVEGDEEEDESEGGDEMDID